MRILVDFLLLLSLSLGLAVPVIIAGGTANDTEDRSAADKV